MITGATSLTSKQTEQLKKAFSHIDNILFLENTEY